MKEFFYSSRQKTLSFLNEYLSKSSLDLGNLNRWGRDVPKRLLKFTSGGKMLRAGLVHAGSVIAGGKINPSLVRVGGAVELIQTGLLIHDDIMDRDRLRRGKPAFHIQYEKKNRNAPEPEHLGVSLGICAGDIAYFLAFSILADSPVLLKRWSDELTRVGLGQMEDIFLSIRQGRVTEKEIMNLYLYKTARYTFSLPLVTGAVLAGASSGMIRKLDRLGEQLGMIFQIKDDEIGLFGQSGYTGKPVGSDIKEGKKTLFIYYLYQSGNQGERKKIASIIGKKFVSQKELKFVYMLLEKYRVRKKTSEKIDSLLKQAFQTVDYTGFTVKGRKILRWLLEYSQRRKK